MASACSNSVISPTAITGIRVAFFTAREWHLIARSDRNLLGWSETAARYMNGGAATRLKRLRKGDCLVDVPAAVRPIGAGHAHRNRTVGREGGAHRIKNF